MLKLLRQMRPREWFLAVVSVIFVAMHVWLELTMPGYMSEITTLVETPGSEMADILKAGLMMLLCAAGSLVCSAIVAISSARIAMNFGATLREGTFKKVQSFSMEEISRFSTASLITRSTNDITQIQMFITLGLQVLVKSPIMAVWAICKIAGKAWQWTFSTGVAVLVLLIVVITCLILATPRFRKVQQLTDDLNRVARENLSGIRVVHAYNAEEYQEHKFDNANSTLTSNQLFATRTLAFMMPSIQAIMGGLTLSIYWIGAVIINSAAIEAKIGLFSDMVVFSQYAMQVVMSFMMLVMIFMLLPRASVAAKRIDEVLQTKLSIIDGKKTDGLAGHKGEIEFKNVSFRYADAEEDVLRDISFTAKKGQTVAIIGSTGCGKSTMINLIPRFYDACDGQVLVDGIDVRDYAQSALRNKIGYVSQKAILFAGSIKSNVAYGENGSKPPTDEDVYEAIKIAQADEFVDSMEGGIDGFVSQGGSNLSGGQKQRISIARAIARKPEILIFDDSFSALDYKTDRVLRGALDKHCSESTRLIVAQRIGTIKDADKIIVLEDGKIAGLGKHDELLKNCDVYKQIALSQLSEEELNSA